MDAKPQRPLRTLRIQSDENAIPPPPPHPTTATNKPQSLLQKHKSTGNLSKAAGPLSTMLNAGGLKGAAKRTAFGDVTNLVKNPSTVREDSGAVGKPSDYVKPFANLPEKATGFARPATRLVNAPAANKVPAIEPTSKLPMGQEQSAAALPPTRTLSKRSTAIYKDNDENQLPPVAPVHQTLAPRHHKSQPQLKHHEGAARRAHGMPIVVDPLESLPAVDRYMPHEDAETSVEVFEYAQLQIAGTRKSAPSQATQNAVARLNRQLPRLPQLPQVPQLPEVLQPSLVSEPEEYWEEEDEEEMYDEAGYTTGGATTGGATTVFFPKETRQARKELAAAKEVVEGSRTPEDIEDDLWDTSMVAEYSEEIFEYMKELELKMLPNANYMSNQTEIQWSMRAVLMDWLIQVHSRFTLLPETLFLCVNYVDRFLSCKIVSLGKLQLVGATAIFVAAKYEEINCPSVSEIVFMVDGGYSTDEILKAERFMLSMLQFELGWPGPYSFLRRISKADEYDLETRTLAKYFLEVAIMDERMVGSPASYVAAGSHCLARMLLKKGEWSAAHVYYSGYTYTQIRPLVALLLECCEQPEKHHNAVFEKFSDRRYKRTAIFVQNELRGGFILPPSTRLRPSLASMEDVDGHMAYETRDSRMVLVKS